MAFAAASAVAESVDPRPALIELARAGRGRDALAVVERELAERPTETKALGFQHLRGHLLEELNQPALASKAYIDALSGPAKIAAYSRYRVALGQERAGHPEVAAGLLATLVAALVLRVSPGKVAGLYVATFNQLKFAMLTIASMLGLAYLMKQKFEEVYQRPIRIEASPWGTDGGILGKVGNTPTVVIGPGETKVAHYPNEFIDLQEVALAAKLFANMILEWCEVSEA